jgi:hypothetical protein
MWVSLEIPARERGYRSRPRPPTQTPIQIPSTGELLIDTVGNPCKRKRLQILRKIDPSGDISQPRPPTQTHNRTTGAPTHQTHVSFRPDLSLDRPTKPMPNGPTKLAWVSSRISRRTDPPNPHQA